MKKNEQLIFVYNAESGFFNGAVDSLHKLISPATYDCSLCKITHHGMGMRRQWKEYIGKLEIPVLFKHRDGITGNQEGPLPAIFHRHDGVTDRVAGPAAIAAAGNVDGLIALLDNYFEGIPLSDVPTQSIS